MAASGRIGGAIQPSHGLALDRRGIQVTEDSASSGLVCTLGHEPPTQAVTAAKVVDPRTGENIGKVHNGLTLTVGAMRSGGAHRSRPLG